MWIIFRSVEGLSYEVILTSLSRAIGDCPVLTDSIVAMGYSSCDDGAIPPPQIVGRERMLWLN